MKSRSFQYVWIDIMPSSMSMAFPPRVPAVAASAIIEPMKADDNRENAAGSSARAALDGALAARHPRCRARTRNDQRKSA
jgi:hypothetical protein